MQAVVQLVVSSHTETISLFRSSLNHNCDQLTNVAKPAITDEQKNIIFELSKIIDEFNKRKVAAPTKTQLSNILTKLRNEAFGKLVFENWRRF